MPMEQKNSNVDVFESDMVMTVLEKARFERYLLKWAHELVRKINMTIRAEVLYLVSFAGMWVLYGRPTEQDVDRALLYGIDQTDDLVKLISRLEGFLYENDDP